MRRQRVWDGARNAVFRCVGIRCWPPFRVSTLMAWGWPTLSHRTRKGWGNRRSGLSAHSCFRSKVIGLPHPSRAFCGRVGNRCCGHSHKRKTAPKLRPSQVRVAPLKVNLIISPPSSAIKKLLDGNNRSPFKKVEEAVPQISTAHPPNLVTCDLALHRAKLSKWPRNSRRSRA